MHDLLLHGAAELVMVKCGAVAMIRYSSGQGFGISELHYSRC
jgi:hypothetical protein